VTTSAFLLLTLTLVVAALDWIAVQLERKPLEYLCKPLTIVLLIGVAFALDVDDPSVRAWFVAALVLSLLGDVFLMLPADLFVPGLVSFLLAHVAYIVGMHVDQVSFGRFLIGIAIMATYIATVGPRIVRAVRTGPDPSLAGPVVAYMIVIGAMVASAIGVGHPAGVVGALLFCFSDTLIAWNRFVGPTTSAPVMIMVTYHLGQMGLVLSLI
jgi:uncharacterized membrane protein YhhN